MCTKSEKVDLDNNSFYRLNKFQERKLSLLEFSEYRERLRKYEYETTDKIDGVFRKKIYHYFLLPVIKVGRLIEHQKLHIIDDKRIHTKRPVIYACTHIGYSDIVMAFEAIRNPCWLLLGNPGEIYRTFSGWLVETNGVICVNTYSKTDRKIAKGTAIRLLKQGGSLMIFPEGAWNVTDALPVMKLYKGTVEMALQTGADIVPVGIEQYGKDFYVNIGRNIKYQNSQKDVQKLTIELRDVLSTLKWQIWENFPAVQRKSFSVDYRQNFVKGILEEGGNKYTMKMIENERYHDKTVTTPEEAFAHLDRLIPCKENAFLFRQQYRF